MTDIYYLIEEIVKKHTITGYLESKNIEPVRKDGSRSFYTCPIPGHDDSTPSFCVFVHKDIEFFKCWGCGSKGTVIQLYKELEQTTPIGAIKALGGDIKIDSDKEYAYIVKQIENFEHEEVDYDLDNYSLLISRLCYDYLVQTEFNIEEVNFIDNVLQRVDDIVYSMDLQSLQNVYNFLADKGIGSRIALFDKKQEEKIKHEVATV